MNEEEDVASFFLKVAEIVNNMKALGETIKECLILQNILRSLPSRFNPKVSAIEETTKSSIPRDIMYVPILIFQKA